MFFRNDYIELPISEIIDRYLNGEHLRIIAKDYGVSHETIRKRLIDYAIPLRSRGLEKGIEKKKLNNKDLATLYKRGFNVKELASMYNVSIPLIYKRLQKQGIEITDPRIIPIKEDRLLELNNQGLTQLQIAKELGVSAMTVNRRLKQLKK